MDWKVGHIVLFNIGDGVKRPLIVVHAYEDIVAGILCLHPISDDESRWANDNCPHRPSLAALGGKFAYFVPGATQGEEYGEWSYKDEGLAEPATIPTKKAKKETLR